jgi:hypothetical protein
VPDQRQHRGPNPADRALFATRNHEALRAAGTDLSWLLEKGYGENAALKLVGDHFELRDRQRLALMRSSCGATACGDRTKKKRNLKQLVGKTLGIDALNCIITVESALSGGVLLRGRDGALRDMASVHGSYRMVEETFRAIGLLSNLLSGSQLEGVVWYLDRPVSNSGRIRAELQGLSDAANWPWSVEMVASPDKALSTFDGPVATSDSVILDRAKEWIDLPSIVVDNYLPGAWIVDFREPS